MIQEILGYFAIAFCIFAILLTSYKNHKEVIKQQDSRLKKLGMLFKGIICIRGELKVKRAFRSISLSEYDEITKRLAPILEEKRRLGF